jgi:hypothetical protein
MSDCVEPIFCFNLLLKSPLHQPSRRKKKKKFAAATPPGHPHPSTPGHPMACTSAVYAAQPLHFHTFALAQAESPPSKRLFSTAVTLQIDSEQEHVLLQIDSKQEHGFGFF